MHKRGKNKREFRFFSQKGNIVLITHSLHQKRYADWLEAQPNVISYECGVPLNCSSYIYVSSIGIRKSYFTLDWETDFLIHNSDSEDSVREFVRLSDIDKDAILEQLEFSRRYWASQGIVDWKMILCMEG